MLIGVLALQGDFREHIWALQRLGVEALAVKSLSELEKVDGLIIPGGESTSIGRIAQVTGIGERIVQIAKEGLPIYGTCAGMILLAKKIVDRPNQYTFGLMDIIVQRNAYGRQIESFEVYLDVARLGKLKAVFIRAPKIVELGKDVEVLASYDNTPILVQQDNLLASSFHPELTDDLRIHEYFVKMVADRHESVR
ncbi:MAG: Glutamine amidotransferase subunit PdxT [Thermotoga sp. 50_1627]|uniref:pyridoxal 5'-phosphate synthase glutaminase subunit PdxT n=1 Tax=Pseudothermotoga sp. TaxID=2033661 RepID=UPI00076C3B39|nr:MAG: Glutamine amidotransferase subunit PdxT [Thermotoga sp. 50_64]KUK25797.1 MAG: Glutamine amidotransferase subunit PdxT [Thermotoga sp. 50_1627]MBC7115482.1 pyridoxal 5'-phosphate synthase glutaminase subunit PdxT [Pseudothermotoga sp.]MDK2922870.1 pyridoxal 5-phosphate synthase pdxT subunit [Pseudothermotoga sp.]HBT40100.1 pyridoxal 5'-phosphate synthase glutaminase subunit PdxT [Pseudothermotoga sp.]